MKNSYRMLGGPLDGHVLMLGSPGTLTFTLNGQTGYYNQNNKWVEV